VRALLLIRILLIAILILQPYNYLRAQYSGEIQSLKLKHPDKHGNYISKTANYSNNGLDLTANRLFNFYKKYISSQDHGSCSFKPSCSEYALISLRKQGFLIGTMNTLDRLSRCNGRTRRHYLQDEMTGLSIDEVRNHKYEKN
jgi:putative component of membrane protein insertase Oxa1/YidC/SpoIIIJ protein YidD